MQSWPALPARPDRLPNRFDVERAVERSDLPAIGRHIILVLCTRMQQGTTLIPREHSPSLSVIAAGTGWDRRTVMRHLNALEELGWIIRHRPDPHLARTRHARTAYTVLMPEPGTGGTQARGITPPGLGTGPAQARGGPPRGLGTLYSEARDRAPHIQTDTDQRTDQSGDSGDLVELVIKQLHQRTGATVTHQWAEKTRDLLLARPGIKNPRAYIIRTITTDPRPERWLPTPGPPPLQEEET